MSNVFVKDDKWGWLPAVQTGTEGEGAKAKAVVNIWQYPNEYVAACDNGKAAGGKFETVKIPLKDYANNCLPLQNVDSSGVMTEVEDMVKLPYLHEPGILYNMKKRHTDDKPYTRTGDIVIAINPFQWFTHLYTEAQRSLYSNKIVWERADQDPRDFLAPHVYETSALCYKGLAFDKIDQSILVSGESGAGKTETVKIAMNHMASVQQGPKKGDAANSQDLDPVVKRVVESNPLLEAFGNASTRRNDNSSRFGKYLCLQFDNSAQQGLIEIPRDRSTCTLAGSKCDVYLLEKNRVTYHDTAERTYHIFYQLLRSEESVKTKFWSKLKGTNLDSFKFVGHTDRNNIEGMTDDAHFQATCNTLDMVGVNGDKLQTLLTAIIVVLQCGNLTFGTLGGDPDKSECTSLKEMDDLAELMDCNIDVLKKAFTERTMKTRTETYKVPLKPSVAKEAAESFAKEVYGKLFLWVVMNVNKATCAEDNYKDGTMTDFGIIGLLDIFGFESFVRNRFEQLCINYANEKLQQKFTEDVFEAVQAEYEAEGIELALITYDDNTDVLDLIEGRGGLLAMLNEECVRPKGSDKDFVNKALAGNKKNEALLVNKMDPLSFGVHHYAGKVMYDADGFVAANQDTLPTDLVELGEASKNEIISNPPLESVPDDAPKKAPKRAKSNLAAPTVWVKYKIQLASLMGNLRKTSSRYIRCIKPNVAKKPSIMDHISTVEQLRSAGVVAAVTLARSAFPNNLRNKDTLYRYRCLWDQKTFPAKKGDNEAETLKNQCTALLHCVLDDRATIDKNGNKIVQFAVGHTKSYFKAGQVEYLEGLRSDALHSTVVKLQCAARQKLARMAVFKIKYAEKLAEIEAQKAREKAEAEARAAAEAAERAKREKELAEQRAKEEAAMAEQRKKEEEERKKREAEEAAERERQIELARQQALKEEEERRKKEEEEAKARQKEIEKKKKKMEKEREREEAEAKKAMKEAERELKELEERKNELQAKYDALMEKAAAFNPAEVADMEKKVEDSDKIVAYLKSENTKCRDETKRMTTEMAEMKDQNSKLVEANSSATASIDSLEKQRKNLEEHNDKITENLKKWKSQNNQLKSDLANRQAYLKAETKIRGEYEKAMEKVVQILEEKCDDHKLLQEVTAAQLQCEAIAAHKTANNPALASSDVSDF